MMRSGRPLTWSVVAGAAGLTGTTCLCGPTLAIAGLLSNIGIPISMSAIHAYAMGVQRFFGPVAEPLLVISLVLAVAGVWQRGPVAIALALVGGSLTLIGLHRFLNTFRGRAASSMPAMHHLGTMSGMMGQRSPTLTGIAFGDSAALITYFIGLALVVASIILAYRPLRRATES